LRRHARAIRRACGVIAVLSLVVVLVVLPLRRIRDGIVLVVERPGVSVFEWTVLGVALLAAAGLAPWLLRRRRGKRSGMKSKPPRVVLPVVATAALAGCAVVAQLKSGALGALFGPPRVTLKEAYEKKPDAPAFDHAEFTRLLEEHVDAEGFVDYEALHASPAPLDAYLERIADAPFDALGRDGKLALLVNAYNACTLRLILDHWPVKSITHIPRDERWKGRAWTVGGRRLTLHEMEHDECRARFREPRVHFALNCASIGCPPLRREAYTAARLEEQLADQARRVHRESRWFRFDEGAGIVYLTRLYDWYGGDFRQVADSVLAYAARHASQLADRDLDALDVRFLDYDWDVNAQESREKGAQR